MNFSAVPSALVLTATATLLNPVLLFPNSPSKLYPQAAMVPSEQKATLW